MFDGKWFAVYSRPGREKKLADLLTRKRIRNYFPLNKISQQWSDRKKVIFEPLFPGYIFAFLCENELRSLARNGLMVNFIYWQDKPAVISNDEIEAIGLFLKEYSFARLEKTFVDTNDRVRAISEPQMLRKGNILEIKSSTAKILLPSLGYVLVAESRKESIDATSVYSEDSIMKDRIA
ncbi:MAG: transcription termination/antitermination NusG family protein [Chitinophagaceae bacterium]